MSTTREASEAVVRRRNGKGLICRLGRKELGEREEMPKSTAYWIKRLAP